MNKLLKRHVIIRTVNEEEHMRTANSIHHQLVGNKDYKDSNIILNIDEPNEINLYIFKECENVPDIII